MTDADRRALLSSWLAAAVLHDHWSDRWPVIIDGLRAALDTARPLVTPADLQMRNAAAHIVDGDSQPLGPLERDGSRYNYREAGLRAARHLLADRFLARAGALAEVLPPVG